MFLHPAQEILEIEQLEEENQGMELTDDNVETVLDEIRPYLVGEHLSCQPSHADVHACSSRTRRVSLILVAVHSYLMSLHVSLKLCHACHREAVSREHRWL